MTFYVVIILLQPLRLKKKENEKKKKKKKQTVNTKESERGDRNSEKKMMTIVLRVKLALVVVAFFLFLSVPNDAITLYKFIYSFSFVTCVDYTLQKKLAKLLRQIFTIITNFRKILLYIYIYIPMRISTL